MLNTSSVQERVSINKVIEPGEHLLKIHSITLEEGYKHEETGNYHLMLNVETPPIGNGFEGFDIDPDDASKGTFKGQIGKIRMNFWGYQDGQTKKGTMISRNDEIIRSLKSLNKAQGRDELVLEAKTINELVKKVSAILADGKNFMKFCVSGKMYKDKKDYIKYNLFLEQPTFKNTPYESTSVPKDESQLFKFNPAVHIRPEKETKSTGTAPTAMNSPVQSFAANSPAFGAIGDFEMD